MNAEKITEGPTPTSATACSTRTGHMAYADDLPGTLHAELRHMAVRRKTLDKTQADVRDDRLRILSRRLCKAVVH